MVPPNFVIGGGLCPPPPAPPPMLQLLSIDICCTRPSSAANQPHVATAVDRRGIETDRRTDTRPLHRHPTAHYSNSVDNLSTSKLMIDAIASVLATEKG